jgi:hypothetical protein
MPAEKPSIAFASVSREYLEAKEQKVHYIGKIAPKYDIVKPSTKAYTIAPEQPKNSPRQRIFSPPECVL